MTIMDSSQRFLVRDAANSSKVAALLLIASVGWLSLDYAGLEDLTSPWVALPLFPLGLIYIAERLGKFRWFVGMTLPCLCVLTASVVMTWVVNTKSLPTVALACSAVGVIAACGFLMVRLFTFSPY